MKSSFSLFSPQTDGPYRQADLEVAGFTERPHRTHVLIESEPIEITGNNCLNNL